MQQVLSQFDPQEHIAATKSMDIRGGVVLTYGTTRT